MTGDELAAKLFTEQGFLVLGCNKPKRVGDIVHESVAANREKAKTPLIIVGCASLAEFQKQASRARILDDNIPGGPIMWDHFYRVGAAD